MYVFVVLLLEMFLFHPISSDEVSKYHVSEDVNGNHVCSVGPPDRTIHRIRSVVVCSGFCSVDWRCNNFNFISNTGLCQLFDEYSTLEEVSIPNCKHYTKQRIEKLTSTTEATTTTATTTITLQSRPATTISSTLSSTAVQSNSVITKTATTTSTAATSLIQTTKSTTAINVQTTTTLTIGLTTTGQTNAATTTSTTTKAQTKTTTTASTTTTPSIISSTRVLATGTTTFPSSAFKTTTRAAETTTTVMQTTKTAATIKTTARTAAGQVTGPTGLPYPTSGLVQQPSTSILIQNNVNTPNAFNRPWLDFKNGFGDSNGNYWLGNDAIHNYLAGHTYQLYVYVYPVNVIYPYLAIYQWYFAVGDSTSNYQLGLSISGGNATSDGMGAMSNQMFSTSDMDNDVDSHNCATTYGSGWWYGGNPMSNGYQCGTTMLNGCGNNFVWAQSTTLTLRASQMWMVY